ncbi:MAG: hypothetical protein LBU91_09280 [Bacteroidales bacterium]|jgi:hypothetical protein|nr:hypothetical protein [Bacteroidales bacterium]
MTTITLQYNEKKIGMKELLNALMKTGCFKQVSPPSYDPEFVKMIKEASRGPKRKLTPALKEKYFGNL